MPVRKSLKVVVAEKIIGYLKSILLETKYGIKHLVVTVMILAKESLKQSTMDICYLVIQSRMQAETNQKYAGEFLITGLLKSMKMDQKFGTKHSEEGTKTGALIQSPLLTEIL